MRVEINNLTIRAYSIPPEAKSIDRNLKPFIAQHLKISEDAVLDYQILAKAVDSRRGAPALVYSLAATLRDEAGRRTGAEAKLFEKAAEKVRNVRLEFPAAPAGLKNPLLIGSGPAGLMAALVLAQAGCEPVIVEGGYDVDRRKRDLDEFHRERIFNPESNYLLGEGGAGTFSDGKLYTGTNDPRAAFVLKTFAEAGAPDEILYLKRPHIGSDNLPAMVRSIREKIEQAGGKFLFGTKIAELIIENDRCRGAVTGKGERLAAPAVIAAHGLGGRALTDKLLEHGVKHVMKGFQIGCRIEHPQAFIDENQYRMAARPAWLEAAEYHLSNRENALRGVPGVSSFCMCPGGTIVPAGLEPGHLSTNGMSRYARDGRFANSCLIATQPAEMFNTPNQAYKFLRALENRAFELGGGDYTAPAQDARAFVKGGMSLKNAESSYAFGLKAARLDKLLPERTFRALTAALRAFDAKFHGFLKYGKIVGVETFISSPVRFLRSPETLESSIAGLYISGEGAGYAGGILSAAADGIKIAEKMLEGKY